MVKERTVRQVDASALQSAMTHLRAQQPVTQVAVRAVAAFGPLAALAASAGAGAAAPAWLVLLVVALVAAYACYPENLFGTFASAVVVLWWGFGVPESLHPSVLVASAALVAGHVAGTLAAYGPPGLEVDPDLAARWVLRGSVLIGCSVGVYLLAVALSERPEPAGVWIAGVVAAVVAGVVASVAVAIGPAPEDDDETPR